MEKIIDFLSQGWVGTIIGILGVVIAIYTYKTTTIGPRLVYTWSSLKIIGKNEVTPDEIEIYFKGIKVPRVIKTTIIIWNSGNKTIEGSNIVKNDPLRLEFSENEEIIGASIIKRTKEFNEVQIVNNLNKENVIDIEFEYLDPKDGVSIEILHTDIKRYPKFKGSIKGMPKGILYWGNKSRQREKKSIILEFISGVASSMLNPKNINQATLFTGILILLSSIIFPIFLKDFTKEILEFEDDKQANTFFIIMFIAAFIYIIPPLISIWNSRKRYPRLLDPERIDNVTNEEVNNGR